MMSSIVMAPHLLFCQGNRDASGFPSHPYDGVSDMTLRTDRRAHFLSGQRVRIGAHALKGFCQGEPAGDFKGQILVAVAVDATPHPGSGLFQEFCPELP